MSGAIDVKYGCFTWTFTLLALLSTFTSNLYTFSWFLVTARLFMRGLLNRLPSRTVACAIYSRIILYTIYIGFHRRRLPSSITLINCVPPSKTILWGTGSRFSACSFIEMLFYCVDMLYRLCKQYYHVIMLSKNQSAHSPGSHLHLINLNICK